MIRRTRILIFLVIILSSTVLLSASSFYQIDTYRALSFPIEITEIRVVQNETSGEYRRIEVSIDIYNPSLTLNLRFYWIDTRIYLNGDTFHYGWGVKGSLTDIPPGGVHSFGWYYPVTEEDTPIFQAAVANGAWNWLLYMKPFIEAGFLGRNEVTRTLLYEGVTLIPI